MPVQKDLKRLVRARMKKTGEAYTAARAHIIDRPPRPASARAREELAAPTEVAAPAPSHFAAIAGMSDEKLKAATACTWERWVHALDRKKAYELTHRDLAKLIREKYKTSSWWTQTVAVGYERIKGLRERGQQRDGTYQATKSRTFAVPVDVLFDAWADARTRRQWLDGGRVRVRAATRPKSIRLDIDGATIAVGFIDKGAGRSAVAVEQDRLPSRDAAEGVKRFWAERFVELGEILS